MGKPRRTWLPSVRRFRRSDPARRGNREGRSRAGSPGSACLLICLTVRTLAPDVRLVAAACEQENIKLLYKAGADVVVAPSLSGGRLMAAAVKQRAVIGFLEDLLAFGEGVAAGERLVRPAEAGKRVVELPDLHEKLVLGVARGSERHPFQHLGTFTLMAGDIVVYLSGGAERATPSGETELAADH